MKECSGLKKVVTKPKRSYCMQKVYGISEECTDRLRARLKSYCDRESLHGVLFHCSIYLAMVLKPREAIVKRV